MDLIDKIIFLSCRARMSKGRKSSRLANTYVAPLLGGPRYQEIH